jgi:hypothetical protein
VKVLVEAAHTRHGFVVDQIFTTYHTHWLCRNKELMAATLESGEVTVFPPTWPQGRKPRTTISAAAEAASAAAAATAAAAAPAPNGMGAFMGAGMGGGMGGGMDTNMVAMNQQMMLMQQQMAQQMAMMQGMATQQPMMMPRPPLVPPVTPVATDTPAPLSPGTRMTNLGNLLERGLIQQAEFDAKRELILGEL